MAPTPCETPCIEWQGRTHKGYAVKCVGRHDQYVHRLAWVEARGPIPDGLFVLHRCDNPLCYNVDHLFLGTAGDNARDMAAKGRVGGGARRGEAHHMAKLTRIQVDEIRRRYRKGGRWGNPSGNAMDLAAEFGVSDSAIRRAARR